MWFRETENDFNRKTEYWLSAKLFYYYWVDLGTGFKCFPAYGVYTLSIWSPKLILFSENFFSHFFISSFHDLFFWVSYPSMKLILRFQRPSSVSPFPPMLLHLFWKHPLHPICIFFSDLSRGRSYLSCHSVRQVKCHIHTPWTPGLNKAMLSLRLPPNSTAPLYLASLSPLPVSPPLFPFLSLRCSKLYTELEGAAPKMTSSSVWLGNRRKSWQNHLPHNGT